MKLKLLFLAFFALACAAEEETPFEDDGEVLDDEDYAFEDEEALFGFNSTFVTEEDGMPVTNSMAKVTLLTRNSDEKTIEWIKELAEKRTGTITKIKFKRAWKVENNMLEKKFEAVRHQLHDKSSHAKHLWHGTGEAAIKGIIETGFRLSTHGDLGACVYLADEGALAAKFSRRANKCHKMLLNKAWTGKVITKKEGWIQATPAMVLPIADSVKGVGRNTIFHTKAWQYGLYRSEQILPEYIVEFTYAYRKK